MRVLVAIGLLATLLAGCRTSGGEQQVRATAPTQGSLAPTARIEKCVDRLLSRAAPSEAGEDNVRRYAKNTYCAPFEQKGWVYDDGALSIAAQTWLDSGEACETEPAVTTGVEESASRGPTEALPCVPTHDINCALLHHVRQSEVAAYIAERQRDGEIQCDDGTPLGELGVP